MVKDHSDSERKPAAAILATLSDEQQGFFYIPQPLLHQSWSTGWNEKQLNGSIMEDRSDDPSHHEQMLLPQSDISLLKVRRLMFT